MARRKVSARAAATLVRADWLGEETYISLRRMDRCYEVSVSRQQGGCAR
jgi:hypothetical protein